MVFPILPANTLSGGYDIDNSIRFNDPDNPTLKLDIGSDGDRRAFTLSMWVKRSHPTERQVLFYQGDDNGSSEYVELEFQSTGDGAHIGFFAFQSSATVLSLVTTGVYRDPSAWYHIVANIDTEQGTEANRASLYINGEKQTSFTGTAVYPDEDADLNIGNSNDDYIIGGAAFDKSVDGYLADVALVDGTQYAASEFGEFDEDSGIWKPKEPDVTWGAKGFFLEFKETGTNQDSSGMGADTSGEDNHLAVTNLAATDQTTDTPTNNFCTLNPLWTGAAGTISEGNTKLVSGSSEYGPVLGTIAMTSGKWYWEVLCTTFNYWRTGIADVTLPLTTSWNLGYESSPDNAVYRDGGYVGKNGSNILSGQPSLAVDETVSVAFDADSGKIWFAQDGAWINSGDPAAGSNEATSVTAGESYYPALSDGNDETSSTYSFNFGNPPHSISSSQADDDGYGNFEFDVPAGFYALCTKNLAEYG